MLNGPAVECKNNDLNTHISKCSYRDLGDSGFRDWMEKYLMVNKNSWPCVMYHATPNNASLSPLVCKSYEEQYEKQTCLTLDYFNTSLSFFMDGILVENKLLWLNATSFLKQRLMGRAEKNIDS